MRLTIRGMIAAVVFSWIETAEFEQAEGIADEILRNLGIDGDQPWQQDQAA